MAKRYKPKTLKQIRDHGRVAGKYRYEGKNQMHASRKMALSTFRRKKRIYKR